MRFNTRDIEVLTKMKGSGEAFKVENLIEFLGEENIPSFNGSLKWKFQQDRPPRRRVTSSPYVSPDSSPSKNQVSSDRQNEETIPTVNFYSPSCSPSHDGDSVMEQGDSSQRHSMVRQRSVGSDYDNTNETKRTKTTALIEVNEDGSFDTPMGQLNISDIQ